MFPENPLIDAVRKVAGDNRIFLVGGPVRDILLNRPLQDYDFVIEGDYLAAALSLAGMLSVKPAVNTKLWTASLKTPWGTVDLTRARQERYVYPGALPRVRPAGLAQDLQRRDFSVNTLAVPLLPQGWGELIDLLGGLQDLRNKQLRILHPQSFCDDPTRIFRAIRLQNRLGFRVEDGTLKRLRDGWRYLGSISPARRYKEWLLFCADEGLPLNLQVLHLYGGWPDCFGKLPFQPEAARKINGFLQQPETISVRRWFITLLALLEKAPENRRETARFWGLSAKDSMEMEKALALLNKFRQQEIQYPLKPCYYRAMQGLALDTVYYLFGSMCEGSTCQRSTWEDFYQAYLSSRFPLSGQDMIKMGLEPGPEMGRLLKDLEERYWQGEFKTKQEGIDLAIKIIEGRYNAYNSKPAL